MSQFKEKLSTSSLKLKFNELLESIDRNNTSKMIVEKYYGQLSSLEVAEGASTPKNVYDELTGKGIDQVRARHMALASAINEKKTSVADSFLISRIQLLESAIKELKSYDWMPSIKEFIKESQNFMTENQVYILIESVIYDLETSKNSNFYSNAIQKLRESSEDKNPIFSVIENLQSEKWIPLVKQLVEYCNSKKGSISSQNPNFTVSRIYSPIESINEGYLFYSSGKLYELKNNEIKESTNEVSDDFKSLVNIIESAKIDQNKLRLYPNHNSVLDISFDEEVKVALNGKLIESSLLENQLISSGYVRFHEKDKLALFQRAISEGRKIKEIDFGYRVTSSIFEGVSVNVFNLNDRIFIQKVNKSMKENSLVEAESPLDAVNIVKEFMNYDISDSIKSLVESEKIQNERRSAELNKVEDRIKFILEKLKEIEAAEVVYGGEVLAEAKNILSDELKRQNTTLIKLRGIIAENSSEYDPKLSGKKMSGYIPLTSKNDLVAGKPYTIDNQPDYVFQGYTDGIYIFNAKDETQLPPIHKTEIEIESMISSKKITR